MDKIIEERIIELYLSGFGSTTIVKMTDIPKRKILKLLKNKNMLRDRYHSDEFYKQFWVDGDKWCGNWVCESCNENIKFCVNNKIYLNRNLNKKKICKSCANKNQKGENNPFYGKKHTEESKKLISEKKIGIKTSDHMSTDKYRKIVSDLAKERWESGKMENTRLKLSQMMKNKHANGELKSINRSKAEFEIIDYLESVGIKCEPNHNVESKIFDIYVPKYNLLIEYNGDYWHCNPKKYEADYYNKKKNKTAKEIWEYDKNKLYLAKNYGYNCIVIWEADYKKNKNIIKEIFNNYEQIK
jgi:G:T-mismatch repair DNA endonuclease (very short patch repair protein)